MDTFTGVLWLTESSGVDRFNALKRKLGEARATTRAKNDRRWSIRPSRDGISLEARKDAQKLLVIAGRQIVTAEKIEILALGTRTRFNDREAFNDTLEQVLQVGALPVIPWGFGKWLGQRGRIVEHSIRARQPFFLGDNGGRLACAPEPKLFKLARREFGMAILPGSDSLPIRDDYRRIGGYGWRQHGELLSDHPGAQLVRMVRDNPPMNYRTFFGQRQGILPFIRNQMIIQIPKK